MLKWAAPHLVLSLPSDSSTVFQFITGIIYILHSDTYTVKPWHVFVVYVALAIAAWVVNVFGVKLLDAINKAALTVSRTALAMRHNVGSRL